MSDASRNLTRRAWLDAMRRGAGAAITLPLANLGLAARGGQAVDAGEPGADPAQEGIQHGGELLDWPHWRGPRYDGISRETGLVTSWPETGPPVVWKRDLGGGYGSVTVARGRLLTQTKEGNEEVVLCLDARSGAQLWDFRYACDYDVHPTLDARFKSGPRATPTIDGSHVYTVGTTGILCCLETKTGNEVWRVALLELGDRPCPDYGYCNSVLIDGESAFVHPGGQKGNSLAALAKRDGSVVWTSLDDRIGWASPVPIDFPVSIDVEGQQQEKQRQIVYFTADGVVGVAARDGKLAWRYPWTTDFTLNVATPIVSEGLLFISSNYGAGAALLRLQANGDPSLVWKSKVMHSHFATCVLFEGHLYGFSTDRLRCVEFRTGTLKWDKPGLGRGSLMIADRRLIILGEHGELVLAEAVPDEYRENARWQALESTCWNVPVLSDGLVYVRNEKQLAAVRVKDQ